MSQTRVLGAVEAEQMQWTQLLLGFSVPAACMIAILNFAPLLPLIRDEFDLSNAWAGALGSATIVAHTVLQIPGSVVPERLGIKRALEAGVALMAVGIAGSALAPSVAILLLCRALIGVGTALSFISALTFVNTIAPTGAKQVVQGWYGAATNVGVLLVMLGSGQIARLVGWRGTFMVEGVALLLVVALIAGFLRSDVRFAHATSASWREVLGHRYLLLLGFAHILTYGAFTGISAWAVTFLWEQYTLGLEWAGILAAFLPASSIVARVIGGRLAAGKEKQVILLSSIVATAGIALLPLMPVPVLALVVLLVIGWFAAMPFGAVFSYPALIGGVRSSGRDLTLVNFVGNIGALGFPPAVGLALDLTGSYIAGFGAVAVVGIIGSACVAIWLPRPRR